jgi:hypothetical protein
MARLHGRQGIVYMAVLSSGQAEPVAFLSSWSINFSADKVDVTAFGDGNKVYVAGLPDAAGQFAGFYDDATSQTYQAALDGQPRKFYLYPSRNNLAQYFYGTVLPDFSVDSSVSDAIKISSSWNASGTITKLG